MPEKVELEVSGKKILEMLAIGMLEIFGYV